MPLTWSRTFRLITSSWLKKCQKNGAGKKFTRGYEVTLLMPPPHPVGQNSFYSAIFKCLIQNLFFYCKGKKKSTKAVGTYSVSTWSSHFLPLGLLSAAIRICVFVKTVPSKWAAPTAFIKIPAWLVAGKENIATLTHSIANQISVLYLLYKPGDFF